MLKRKRTLACAASAAILSLPFAASAQGVGADRMERLSAQLDLLDSRAAQQYEFSDRLRPESRVVTAIPRYDGAYRGPWLAVARSAARRHGIPEDLFLRLVQQESGWDTSAVSHAGAIGLAQLMPDTAARLGVDPHDAHDNLDGGARYLAQQYRRFGDWRLALAAYNAGPEAVVAHDGIPPFAETQGYVRAILGA
ncbi:MAG: lytic transglycosylase domain-containing protein [Rhodobacteraceae bacterium CG17_big_fil_post_rev_8_21_14_2_50_65_11]|nr:MAG: lytic transglycosylase domain-containing protein [Rhodobacteraceae bacterium CG17_big_fil_post_rev_8_21_14_2_50_65_11]